MLLYQGDCLEEMKKIPDGSIDMILCDLPYGTTARNKWDNVIDFEKLWAQYDRVAKKNAAVVLFASQPFTIKLGASNVDNLKYEWIWVKDNTTGFQNANRMPMKNHEDILVFYRSQPTYNPQGLIPHKKIKKRYSVGTNYNDITDGQVQEYTNYPNQILEFGIDRGSNRFHPTQKPVLLLEYLINTYTNTGETVLDNCMGSGSTGVACVNTGRRFVGIELDEKYYGVACTRIKEAECSERQLAFA